MEKSVCRFFANVFRASMLNRLQNAKDIDCFNTTKPSTRGAGRFARTPVVFRPGRVRPAARVTGLSTKSMTRGIRI